MDPDLSPAARGSWLARPSGCQARGLFGSRAPGYRGSWTLCGDPRNGGVPFGFPPNPQERGTLKTHAEGLRDDTSPALNTAFGSPNLHRLHSYETAKFAFPLLQRY